MSKAQCQTACGGSSSCWSGISTHAGLCILLESRSGSEALTEVTMFKKSCVTGNYNMIIFNSETLISNIKILTWANIKLYISK